MPEKKYAKKQKVASGAIFRTRSGKKISRRQIWAELKGLCRQAGVEPTKVFPHNLRHLFATLFYKACKDIVRLADVLGHSSIETTRIYLITSGEEHQRQIESLGLVSVTHSVDHPTASAIRPCPSAHNRLSTIPAPCHLPSQNQHFVSSKTYIEYR